MIDRKCLINSPSRIVDPKWARVIATVLSRPHTSKMSSPVLTIVALNSLCSLAIDVWVTPIRDLSLSAMQLWWFHAAMLGRRRVPQGGQ
jgi:hypothetical protein